MKNLLTIDVEEYFQVEGFADVVDRGEWDRYESRVVPSTRRLLDLLDDTGHKATFFVLAWCAERHPAMVREIVSRGHEVASHGYGHRMITSQDADSFRADLRRSREVLERLTGRRMLGYRAPSFSITPATPWAHEVIAEEGFAYSSSVFPVHHDRYGIPDAPRTPWQVDTAAGPLTELPPLTLRMAGQNLPVAGGGYMRLLPVRLVAHAVRRMNAAGAPAMLYLHPWEVDPEQPRLPGRRANKFRHYVGLDRMHEKLRYLLERFEFETVAAHLELSTQPGGRAPRTVAV